MRFLLALSIGLLTVQAANYPNVEESDYVIARYKFRSGEFLETLKLHYTTLGTAMHDSRGAITNAVLILHGSGGTGHGFLDRDYFHGELFGHGQPLDAAKYYIILPDNVGHGKSSKPSDGLRTGFPHYGYLDMVDLQKKLLEERLGISHLRLVMGTSMGCMHSWIWATEHPADIDAAMPLGCLPYPITGRNLLWRKMMIDLIQRDPNYHGGNYNGPIEALRATRDIQYLMTQNTLDLQARGNSTADARKLFEETRRPAPPLDANDLIYQFDSSRDYDPDPKLELIQCPVTAINFADDPVNPPELGILDREIKRGKHGRAMVMPATEATHGHSNHTYAARWKQELGKLLEESTRQAQ
jgi:homoserine O-acetyltransferase